MPVSKLLAKAKLQSLDRNTLNALIQSNEGELLQSSHYTVDGSLEELIQAVWKAFKKWQRCDDEYEDYLEEMGYHDKWELPYRWSYILATYDDKLCFYTDSYSDNGQCYYCVSYDVVDGVVHIGTDVTPVAATIVLRDLGLGEDSDGDEVGKTQSAQGEKINEIKQAISTKERNGLPDEDFGDPKGRKFPINDQDDVDSAKSLVGKASNPSAVKARIIKIAKRKGLTIPDAWKPKKQSIEGEQPVMATKDETIKQNDTVTEGGILADASAATPVEHSDKKPKGINKPDTEADSTGAATSATGNPTAATPVQHSDSDISGSGNLNTPGCGIIDAALADTAAGTKQSATTEVVAPKLLQSSHRDKTGESMSYMKLQSTVDAANGKKHMKLQGVVTRGDIVNSEGQVYPLSVWETNLQSMNTKAEAGKFIGKLEHPDKELGLQDAAIKFDKFWIQGSDVWADCTVIPTFPDGQNLQAMIEAGVSIDFSSRGYGTMKQSDWRGVNRDVVQNDFECVAFDAVWYGASTGSGVKGVQYQSKTTNDAAPALEQGKKDEPTMPELTPAQIDAAQLQAAATVTAYRENLVKQSGLNSLGQDAYTKALDKCTDIESMFAAKTNLLPALQSAFAVETPTLNQSATYAPTFLVKQSAEEMAPKSVGEMFDRMVADMPDAYPGKEVIPGQPSHFQSPKAACRKLLGEIAQSAGNGFHGLSAARALLALEQGKVDRADSLIKQSNLYQSFSADSTIANANANNDGAPLSAPLIFPLVRRVFPKYIMNEIATIQPMDRPQGKIFYLDAYRTEDPSGQEKRIDLNTSANPFNSSYSDNNTEGTTAQLIRLRLTSLTVSAYEKKIGAQWSIEEMQDLRAYHGLDAAQELMGATAREMALEWNKAVLDDMLAQATAAALTYGTTPPASGFPNQKDWDEYIWRYVMKLDNAIFSKRNGPMTHIVCGVDAALALNSAFRGVLTLGSEGDQSMELYPGTTFYGSLKSPTGGIYKVFKTNFWTSGTTNGSKILGLRRGSEWSDTPYIWAPYTDYVTPQLTDPSDFSQRQGIMSRAAKQVVVSDAMGYITVQSGQTGAVVF